MATVYSRTEVLDAIHRLSLAANHVETEEYIASLTDVQQADPQIAIYIALHYFSISHLNRALLSLEKSNCYSEIDENHCLLREEVACTALLKAQIDCQQKCKYREAQVTADRIEDLYVNLKIFTTEPLSDDIHNNFDIILSQSIMWQLEEPSKYDSRHEEISKIRCLIEVLLIGARLDGIHLGIASPERVYPTCRERLLKIQKILRYLGYRLMEATLIFACDGLDNILGSKVRACEFLEEFERSLSEDDPFFLRIQALNQLCKYSYSSGNERAREYLDQSQRLSELHSYDAGIAACSYSRLFHFPHGSHLSGQRIDQWIRLAWVFSDQGAVHDELLCVLIASKMKPLDRTSYSELETAYKKLSLDCDRVGWSYGSVWALACGRLPALSSIEDYLDSGRAQLENMLSSRAMHARLSPALEAEVFYSLAMCHRKQGNLAQACHYMEKRFLSERSNNSYEYRSRARNQLALMRVVSIQSEIGVTNAMNSTSDTTKLRLERCRARTTKEIMSLERWASLHKIKERLYLRTNTLGAMFSLYALLWKFFGNQVIQQKLQDVYSELYALSTPVARTKHLTGFLKLAREKLNADPATLSLQILEYATESAFIPSRNSAEDQNWSSFLQVQTRDFLQPDVLAQDRKASLSKQLDFLRQDLEMCNQREDSETTIAKVPDMLNTLVRYIKHDPTTASSLKSEAIGILNVAEKACETLRRQMIKDEGLPSLIRKRNVVSKLQTQQLFVTAATFFLELEDLALAWDWIQKNRSRSLLDIMSRPEIAKRNITAKSEISARQDSASDLESEPTSSYDMAVDASLKDLAEFSDGLAALSHGDLDEVFQVARLLPKEYSLVLVDWFVSPGIATPRNPLPRERVYMISIDSQERVFRSHEVGLPLKQIIRWSDVYLMFQKDNDDFPLENLGALKGLIQLVEGLLRVSRPNDLLLFTPPQQLSALPLHAIPLGEGLPTVIERNPVIYNSSVSLFQECLRRSRSATPGFARDMTRAQFAAAFENKSSEREKIFSLMDNLKETFEASSVNGTELTSDRFGSILSTSPWVHYHGHVAFEKTDALNQRFLLSNGVEQKDQAKDLTVTGSSAGLLPPNAGLSEPGSNAPSANTSIKSGGGNALSVVDIFRLSLRAQSPTIVAIACDSNLQDVSAGDEPLGLISALLVAGATSTIGTLWPIRSGDGRAFTGHFYKSVEAQIALSSDASATKESKNLINLAQAVRSAVISMKKSRSTRAPYSWAGFVVHGAGFHFCSQEPVRDANTEKTPGEGPNNSAETVAESSTTGSAKEIAQLSPSAPKVGRGPFIVVSYQFRRLVEQSDIQCYLMDVETEYRATANRIVSNAWSEYCRIQEASIILSGSASHIWACNFGASGRLSLNLRYIERSIPKGSYQVAFHFAYVYRVTEFDGQEINWTRQHQSDLTMIAGSAVNENHFMARTSDSSVTWISGGFDGIIFPRNRIFSTLKVPFVDYDNLSSQRVGDGYVGARVRHCPAHTVDVPENGSLAFFIRKTNGGERATGWLYFFGVELVPTSVYA